MRSRSAGFVVLRYDKRGVGKSAGSSETRTNLIADARSAFEFVQAQKDVDAKHVYLLGHSEGGLLVPSVAASDPHVAGIILMAAPALPLWQLSMEQVLEMTPPAQRAAARREELAQLAEIRRGKKTGAGMAWYRSEMDVRSDPDSPASACSAADPPGRGGSASSSKRPSAAGRCRKAA